ncbi:MAG: TerC/Alx family metal homeostasis membrane protein, partial [Phycisphaerales bacterium]
ALVFNVIVYFLYEARVCGLGLNVPQLVGEARDIGGWEAAKLFLTGYLVEQSLSADNVMVIAVILASMKVPAENQRRVLYWGIVGALVLRGLMIFLGVELIRRFDWVLYIFGAMLLLGALKMLMGLFKKEGEHSDPADGWTARLVSKCIPLSRTFDGEKFFTRSNGTLMATPLFLALIIVELTDLIFAVDSIPAVFSITLDPFIIFTSNVCAILGLRSLYFCVAALMRAFAYLTYALIAILVFVAMKMLLRLHLDETISLGIIVGILALGVGASLLWGPKKSAGA